MMKPIRLLAVGLGMAGLAACGGGGGGSNAAPPATLATITTTNAPDIAGAVMAAALEGGDLGGFAGLAGPITSAPSTVLLTKVGSIPVGQAKSMLEESQIGTFQAPIDLPPVDCASSGTYSLTGNLANTGTLTAGDMITFDYDMCNDGLVVIDGTMAMSITSFSGDFVSGTFSFGVTVQLTGFTVTEGGQSATANGDISMTLAASPTGSSSLTISSSSLDLGAAGGTHTLSDYTVEQTTDDITGAYTLDVSGSLTSSAFSGRVDFETTVVLEGVGSGLAFVGEVVITGAQSSTIRVTILGSSMIRLEIDTDGDGTPDQIVDTTWDELT